MAGRRVTFRTLSIAWKLYSLEVRKSQKFYGIGKWQAMKTVWKGSRDGMG